MRQLLGTIALLLLALPASAQSVVVVVGEAPSPAEIRAAVIEAIAERGVRLVRTPDGTVCEDDPNVCAADLASTTGADGTLRVEAEVGETSRVRVFLVPPEGDPIEAIEDVIEANFASAAAAAVVTVLSRERETAGFLLVRSDPSGALVEIDGEDVGRTPLRHTVTPGDHTVRLVHAEGTHEETVSVESRREASIEHDLGGSDGNDEHGPAPEQVTSSEPSPFNWIIGGGLAIAGVVTLISPLSTLAREGECVEMIENVGCVEQVRIGAQTAVLLGVGLAALIAAVIVDVVAPIQVDVEVSGQGAALSVAGAF